MLKRNDRDAPEKIFCSDPPSATKTKQRVERLSEETRKRTQECMRNKTSAVTLAIQNHPKQIIRPIKQTLWYKATMEIQLSKRI
jgi:hypothetical protein